MFKNLLLAGALALALSVPAAAQECRYTFDAVAGSAMMDGWPVHMINEEDLPAIVDDAEELVGNEIEGVTRGFVFLAPDGKVVLGLEVDGCLLPRIILNEAPAAGNGA